MNDKHMLYRMIHTICAIIICNSIFAQTTDLDKVSQLFGQVQKKYKSAKGLAFVVRYEYALEDKPDVVIDSLEGNVSMNAGAYGLSIDNIETICTGNKVITIYKEEKVMYLTDNPANASQNLLPLSFTDPAFLKQTGLTISIEEQKENQEISLVFPPGKPYKSIVFTIDRNSGYMKQVIYLMKSNAVNVEQNSSDSAVNNPATQYAVVKANFRNYRNEASVQDRLAEDYFVTRIGSEFVPTEKYKGFNIYNTLSKK